jgi:hypothetical protein
LASLKASVSDAAASTVSEPLSAWADAVAVVLGCAAADPQPVTRATATHAVTRTALRMAVQTAVGSSMKTLVALTAATASMPGARFNSSAASRLISETTWYGPAWSFT